MNDLDQLEQELGPRLKATFNAYLSDDGSVGEESTPRSGSESTIPPVSTTVAFGPRRRRLLSIAAAALLIVAGGIGVWQLAGRSGSGHLGVVPSTASTMPPSDSLPLTEVPPTVAIPQFEHLDNGNSPNLWSVWIGDFLTVPKRSVGPDLSELLWDPIPVAPGTIGWFEAGDGLPASFTRVPWSKWDETSYLAGRFTCRTWTLSDEQLPTCTELVGGNYLEEVNYNDDRGGALGIGVHLGGETDPLAWLDSVASGVVHGTGQVLQPTVTDINVGASGTGDVVMTKGYGYRSGDRAYLAWEYRPGVIVWLHSVGLSDEQLASIAADVRPAVLPRTLPLKLRIDPLRRPWQPDFAWRDESFMAVGYLNGQPCFATTPFERCANVSAPALFGDSRLVAEANSSWFPGFAAVAPTSLAATLRVNVDGVGWKEVPLQPTGLGFDAASWHPNGERAVQTQLVAADGSILADSGTLSAAADDAFEIVAEGRTGKAWVVTRQRAGKTVGEGAYVPIESPTEDSTTDFVGTPFDPSAAGPYCLMLQTGEITPQTLCPPDEPPSSGLGQFADYHDALDLVEVAANVKAVQCDGAEMPIFEDPELDNRRFAVITCDNPTTS